MEAYRDGLTQNGTLRFPTLAERMGDFSATSDTQGRLVNIYDPLTTRQVGTQQVRDPISCNGRVNVICPERFNPVGVALASYLPIPDSDVSNGSPNYFQGDVVKDQAQQFTVKVDHQINQPRVAQRVLPQPGDARAEHEFLPREQVRGAELPARSRS